MEDKIEAREYVKTKDGRIAQIKSVDYEAGIYRFDKIIYINDFGMKEDVLYNNEMFKKVIVKHSKNLIDLIKPGELIKTEYGSGWFHHKIDEKSFLFDDGEKFIEAKNENLISILTHEQYEANCYTIRRTK